MSVLTTGLLLQHADASQNGKDADSASGAASGRLGVAAATKLLEPLAEQLGDAYGGAFYDADKQRLVVNVVGREAASRVNQAGAVARNVRNSSVELAAAARTLAGRATIPGTSWAVDPRTNQVLVTADRTVVGKRWDRLQGVVDSLGAGTARIQKSAGEFKTFAAGGDAIFGGGARCSLGFNVTTDDGSPGFLTAGHCTVAAQAWSDEAGGAPVATVQAATFPGDGDFGLVTYDDAATDAPSVVDTGDGRTTRIVRVADAAVGLEVSRMGSTTGLRSGVVTGLDATVNYPEGTVTGLIQTNVCAEPGDSGGPLFSVDEGGAGSEDDGGSGSAVGLTSGGSGDCTAGGETFFQPVSTALSAVGARIGDN